MTKELKFTRWMEALTKSTHEASRLIGAGVTHPGTPRWAIAKLRSAHEYVYAAMIRDFVVTARRLNNELVSV